MTIINKSASTSNNTGIKNGGHNFVVRIQK